VHEWALAEGVIATALMHSTKEKFRRVTKLVVRIGELQHIDPDFFRRALESVIPTDDTRLASLEFELRVEPAGFDCRRCRHRFSLEDAAGELDHERQEAIHFIPELAHGYLACPKCSSPDFEVTRGRGIWLDAIEGET
jgi:hydrogenase nickel incorporation protein HypA/HybF